MGIWFKKVLTAAIAVAAIGVASGNASATGLYPEFTINPSAYGGPAAPVGGVDCPGAIAGSAGCLVADKIIGGYGETYTASNVVVDLGTGAYSGHFSVDVWYDFDTYKANDGLTAVPAVDSGLDVNYNLYGLFTGGGDFSCTALSACTFTPTTGNLEVWRDVGFTSAATRTTFTTALPANSLLDNVIEVNPGQDADDERIATALLFSGQGSQPQQPCSITNAQNCGSFTVEFYPFQLEGTGASYFVAPNPFHITVDLSGQFNSFNAAITNQINGSADAVFAGTPVPEPATLTLFGLGLVAAAARRRKSTKRA